MTDQVGFPGIIVSGCKDHHVRSTSVLAVSKISMWSELKFASGTRPTLGWKTLVRIAWIVVIATCLAGLPARHDAD